MTTPTKNDRALRSVHTPNFPEILQELGISLVVSTYQAGKLVVIRADGEELNTHFRDYQQPMGVAVDAARLFVGTAYQIWELHNVPAATGRLTPAGKHDRCYLPRRFHITGAIDVHEMAYAQNELWFINTRFSCLCTLDTEHSFVPRWRPPFVTAYDTTDRCHLNGLGIRDDRPRYITALGETDQPDGWRATKINGGLLMDMESNQPICRGLSMPHSPRWHAERLWVLESGKGTLAVVDPVSATTTTVAEMPGFTRGLDFHGPLAFIGLSQVRESAVFGGLPITERVQDRNCGVWVVNIETGETVAFLRFEEAVQEVFAVAVLPNTRFPELLSTDDEDLLRTSYVLPDAAMKEVVQPVSQDKQQSD